MKRVTPMFVKKETKQNNHRSIKVVVESAQLTFSGRRVCPKHLKWPPGQPGALLVAAKSTYCI